MRAVAAGVAAAGVVGGLLAVVPPAVAASPATATTVSSTEIRYRAGPGQVNRPVISVTYTDAGFSIYHFRIDDTVPITPSGRCARPDPDDLTVVVCDGDESTNGDPVVRLWLGDRDDSIDLVRPDGSAVPGVFMVDGGTGNDSITARQGQYWGGAGNDRITGPVTAHGGDGADVLAGSGRGYGDGGDDRFDGSGGRNWFSGGAGRDTIRGEAGGDTLLGDDGDDVIYGGTDGDTIYGGAGADTIQGNSGDDRIQGNAGDDVITGGPGADRISGGPGRNRITQ
jgi:serralysin